MNIYWLELKRFFQEKINYIVMGTLILGLILSFFLMLTEGTDSEEEIVKNEREEIFETKSQSSYFRFYIEKQDGSSFSNGSIMNELFNMENIYKKVLLETDIDINKIIDTAEEKEYFDFSPVTVKFDGNSNIYAALFGTGDNLKNMQIASFYYDYLLDDNFTVLESHRILPIDEPELIEDEENTQSTGLSEEKYTNIKNTIINIIFAVVAAFGLTTGILILKELFGKNLSFLFGYKVEEFDDFIVYDKKFANKKSIQYFLGFPEKSQKLILTESNLNKTDRNILFADNNLHVQLLNSIEYAPVTNIYDEIILIIKTGETTRKWYEKQVSLLELHDTKNKVIQLNNIDS